MLSVDGVSETKSTTTSLDVYSLKFIGCRDIYPIAIVRPLQKNSVNHETQFNAVLLTVLNADLVLKALIGDNPKRAFLRYALQHSARCACEYCFESGISLKDANEDEATSPILNKIQQQKKDIQQEINFLLAMNERDNLKTLHNLLKYLNDAEAVAKKQKSSHIVWPANTMNGESRTKQKIMDIVEKIEAGNEMTPLEKKGIKGKSPVLDIEYFDFVLHIPTEYMHLYSLGVMKRLIELSFNVGEKRTRITKRPLCSPTMFDECMKKVKSVREFSRRSRKLDLAVMKAQELRNLGICFPHCNKMLSG